MKLLTVKVQMSLVTSVALALLRNISRMSGYHPIFSLILADLKTSSLFRLAVTVIELVSSRLTQPFSSGEVTSTDDVGVKPSSM